MSRPKMEQRTRTFNIDVLRLCRQLPKDPAGWEVGKQLVRSSGSVGANHRASGRAKSPADFTHKLEVVLEEADECHYWLTIIKEADLLSSSELDRLIGEANELTAIFTTSVKTAKRNQEQKEKEAKKRRQKPPSGD
ncbi:MAG: four helix bundle protein [Chitinophagaceae bacterium]|nr:MAG: four helix bundle protein [Chitinophagaceae bacterium]